jgi:hypothetical protein
MRAAALIILAVSASAYAAPSLVRRESRPASSGAIQDLTRRHQATPSAARRQTRPAPRSRPPRRSPTTRAARATSSASSRAARASTSPCVPAARAPARVLTARAERELQLGLERLPVRARQGRRRPRRRRGRRVVQRGQHHTHCGPHGDAEQLLGGRDGDAEQLLGGCNGDAEQRRAHRHSVVLVCLCTRCWHRHRHRDGDRHRRYARRHPDRHQRCARRHRRCARHRHTDGRGHHPGGRDQQRGPGLWHLGRGVAELVERGASQRPWRWLAGCARRRPRWRRRALSGVIVCYGHSYS